MRSRATPAVPAMPMTEKSSAALTFSIEWEAMRLPIVALRSPAMRIPVAVRKQMIVVPSGVCPARSRPAADGSASGVSERASSTNELLVELRNAGGNPDISLAALLDEVADELLRVRLQDAVDLIEDGVDVLSVDLPLHGLRRVDRCVGPTVGLVSLELFLRAHLTPLQSFFTVSLSTPRARRSSTADSTPSRRSA